MVASLITTLMTIPTISPDRQKSLNTALGKIYHYCPPLIRIEGSHFTIVVQLWTAAMDHSPGRNSFPKHSSWTEIKQENKGNSFFLFCIKLIRLVEESLVPPT